MRAIYARNRPGTTKNVADSLDSPSALCASLAIEGAWGRNKMLRFLGGNVRTCRRCQVCKLYQVVYTAWPWAHTVITAKGSRGTGTLCCRRTRLARPGWQRMGELAQRMRGQYVGRVPAATLPPGGAAPRGRGTQFQQDTAPHPTPTPPGGPRSTSAGTPKHGSCAGACRDARRAPSANT